MTMYVIAFILVVVASHQYEKNQELEKQRQTKKKKPEGNRINIQPKKQKESLCQIFGFSLKNIIKIIGLSPQRE